MSRKSLAPKKRRARRPVEPLVFDWPDADLPETSRRLAARSTTVTVARNATETAQAEKARKRSVARSAARSVYLHGGAAATPARSVAVPDDFERAVIGVHLSTLCRACYALGQHDAAMVLIGLGEAIEDGDPYLPARLSAAADPRTVKGRVRIPAIAITWFGASRSLVSPHRDHLERGIAIGAERRLGVGSGVRVGASRSERSDVLLSG